MREPDKWDLLIGHYLGVDHVGHTYDVHSPHMVSKLQQMNQHVDQVRCACHKYMTVSVPAQVTMFQQNKSCLLCQEALCIFFVMICNFS